MTEKQQGKLKQEIDQIFAGLNITANDIGMIKALLLANQQLKIYLLIDEAKNDRPNPKYYPNAQAFHEVEEAWYKKWFGVT